jgi:nitroreductase
VLGLPDGAELVVMTPLGFPADEPGFKRRKDIDEIVRYETW